MTPTTLPMSDHLRIASTDILKRPLRTALSILAVALGIASLVAVVGIGESSRAELLEQLDRLGTNRLTATPGQTALGRAATLPPSAPSMIGAIDGVVDAASIEVIRAVSVRRTGWIPAEQTGGLVVASASPHLLSATGSELAGGAFLNAGPTDLPLVVLGATAARRLGFPQWRPGLLVWIHDTYWAVAGILKPSALTPELDQAALVTDRAGAALGATRHPTSIYALTTPQRLDQVRALIPAMADPEHPSQVRVSRPSDALAARAAAQDNLQFLMAALGVVALLAGGVGIANLMIVSVVERRSEIGLRVALGATRTDIRSQFALEALFLGGLGGVVGACAGCLVTAGTATVAAWPVVVPWAAVVTGIVAAFIVGGLAGIAPAARAARIAPAQTLRGL